MAHLFLHPLRGSDTLSEGAEHGGTVDKDVRMEENLNSGCLVHTQVLITVMGMASRVCAQAHFCVYVGGGAQI